MNWQIELAYLITPKSGPMRPMATLVDANRAILDDVPTHARRQEHWIQAKRAVLAAAETGSAQDVQAATDALLNAVMSEGWMSRPRP